MKITKTKKHFAWVLLSAATAALLMTSARGQVVKLPPGQLAVLQEGDGGTNRGVVPSDLFGSRQNPIFVDVFDPAGVNQLVPSVQIAIPTNGPSSLWVNGNAGTEGYITLSSDRTAIALTGYSGDICSIQPGTAPSNLSYDRGIGKVDAFGNYTQVYRGGAWYGIATGKTNPRGVATDGFGQFWGCGNGYGSMYFDARTGADPIQFQNIALTSASRIINNTLYASVKGSESISLYPPGIYSFVDFFNQPAPIPSAASFLRLAIPVTAPYTNCIGFDINPDFTLAYVADASYGIQKYVRSGLNWNLAYNLAIPGYTNFNSGVLTNAASTNTLVGCFSLVVDWTGSYPVVFATTGDSPGYDPRDAKKGALVYYGNRVIRIDDTNEVQTAGTIVATPDMLKTVAQAVVGDPLTNANYVVYKSVAFTPDLRPLITQNPTSHTVVAGSGLSFDVAATSASPATFQWLKNGTPLPNQTSPSLGLVSVSVTDTGSRIQCSVANSYGAVTSDVAVLTVSSVPTQPVLGPSVNLTNFVGNNLAIKASASGTEPIVYRWFFNDVSISDGGEFSGAGTSTLTISNAQPADSGVYSVAATNGTGNPSIQIVAKLVVQFSPPIMVNPPQPTASFIGRDASLNSSVYGTSLSYRWYTATKTGGNPTLLSDINEFNGTATPTLQLNGAKSSDATNYILVVSNPGGSVTSAPVALTLTAEPSHGFVSFTNASQIYEQSFDSLPVPGGGSFDAANPQNILAMTNFAGMATNLAFNDAKASATLIYSLDNPVDFSYPVLAAGFIGGLGLSNSMSGWYGWSSGSFRMGATSGDQSAGGLIDNGANYNNINHVPLSSITNRALGLISTTKSGTVAFGLGLLNKSTNTFKKINLSYVGELWRNNPNQQPLGFSYAIDLAGSNASFHPDLMQLLDVTNLDVIFPTNQVTQITEGGQASNQVSCAVSGLSIRDWTPGSVLWLVWQSRNPVGGGQDVAIDNLRFSVASDGATVAVRRLIPKMLPEGAFQLSLTDAPGGSFSVLSTTNLGIPPAQWQVSGHLAEGPPGQYQFIDTDTSGKQQKYYILRQP